MFGNSLNYLTTFKYGHFEPELGHAGPLEAETGYFLAAGRCVKAVFETLETFWKWTDSIMFGNSLNHLTTFKCRHFEHSLGKYWLFRS